GQERDKQQQAAAAKHLNRQHLSSLDKKSFRALYNKQGIGGTGVRSGAGSGPHGAPALNMGIQDRQIARQMKNPGTQGCLGVWGTLLPAYRQISA
ncbi:hypothetical protein, partial [Achromobacter xylosoxidans]|uniref:hypothetical protein n=1 Tax=Alcaligenes xylosoxydans xylosoxydans TaxID=85698 RepID=UPI001F132B0C